jgi:predicted amidohydrolase
MTIGFIQNSPQFGNKEANLRDVTKLATGLTCDLLVLPELFATGYTFTHRDEVYQLSEDVDGMTIQTLKELSADSGAILIAGWIERDGDRVYNSSVMVYNQQVIGNYRKIHLFNRENVWFSPGNREPQVYDVNGTRIGMMICFDWFFPEMARTLALKGARILAHPSNLVLPWCQKAMVTRCLENNIFAVTANRIGSEQRGEDSFHFTGGSQITSPKGEILISAPTDSAYVGVVNIDDSEADNKSLNPFNNLWKDRKTEYYSL